MSSPGNRVGIESVGLAVPPFKTSQKVAHNWFVDTYGDMLRPGSLKLMSSLMSHPSIASRFIAVDTPAELVKETSDDRMERYTKWAERLSVEAAHEAFKKAECPPAGISALVVSTCTGYICPGLSTYILQSLELPKDTRCYDFVGGGCGASLPNLQICSALLHEHPDWTILSISVEICSATMQVDNSASLLVSNAIFGDGASAVLLSRSGNGPKVVDFHSSFCPEHREDVRYTYKNGDLHNQLSKTLPQVISNEFHRNVEVLLSRNGLTKQDISHWALHPGGERILSAIQEELELEPTLLQYSRDVLKHFGNMSSPTIWFVWDAVTQSEMKTGNWAILAAYGAGLSIHSALVLM